MSSEIPDGVQLTVKELAARMECFVERANNGGSWIELHTWLLAMRPGFELLVEGMDLPRSARMTISPERQDEIAKGFTVPDNFNPSEWRNQ